MRKDILPHVDALTGALTIQPHIHHKVHEGQLFSLIHEAVDIASASSQYYLIRTPSTGIVHFNYTIAADAKSRVRFYEAPTTTADGAVLTPVNTNRLIDSPTTLLAFTGPTVSAPGLLINVDLVGAQGGKHGPSVSGHADMTISEWNLKQSTDYLIQAEANGATTSFALQASFYITN